MANNDGKLWFEMDVRDKITGAMQNAIDEAIRLGSSIEEATKNVETLKRALYKIREVSSRASSAIGKGMELGIDTSKLQAGLDKLNAFEKKLLDLQKGGRLASEKDILKNFLGADYQAMLRTMSKVTAEQEKMNAAQIKSSERQADLFVRNYEIIKKTLFDIQTLGMQANNAFKNGLLLNVDTSKLEKAIEKLELFGQKLRSLNDKDLAKRDVKSILGSEYEIAFKNLQQLVREQEKLNSLKSKSNTRNSDIELRNMEALRRSMNKLNDLYSRFSGIFVSAKKLGVDTNNINLAISKYKELSSRLENLRNQQGFATDKNFIKKNLGADFQGQINFIKRLLNEQNKLNSAKEKENRISSARAKSEELRARQVQLEVNERLISSYNRVSNAMSQQGRVASQLRNVMSDYLSIYTGANILKSIITTGGEFETQRIAMQTLLGDLREGLEIYGQIKSLAIESPKSFLDLASYTKQLAAYNIPYEELYDTTKRLADISSGLGVDMSRLILAYGQVRSATVLRGQELRQFTEAGIPMVDALAKKFSELNGTMVTSADVLNKLIPTRQVPFEMVKEVLEDMTNEGGRFYNMQLVLADTLAGKWSNLRDAWEVMLSGIADGRTLVGQFFKLAVSGTTELIKSLDTLLPLIGGVAASLGIKKALGIGAKFAGFNTSQVESSFLNAKEMEAQRIMRKSLTEEISDKEKEILETRNKITAADYKLLATSGKLNVNQMAYLYANKKINVELLDQLVKSNAITEAEKKKILAGRTYLGILKQQTLAIGGAFTSMLKDPYTWVTLIISAGTAIYNHYEEISIRAKNAMDSIIQRSTQVQDAVDAITREGKPAKDEDISSKITSMLGELKKYSADYAGIKNQSDAIENLSDKYDYLANKLKEVSKAYKNLADDSNKNLLEDMQKAAGGGIGGFFSGNWEGLGADMEDYDESIKELEKYAVKLNSVIGEKIKDAIKKIAESNAELKKSLQGKEGLSSMLRTFFENASEQEWDKLVYLVPSVSNYRIKFRDVQSDLMEIYRDMDESVQTFIDEKEAKGWDFSKLSEQQKEEAKIFMEQFLSQYENASKEVKQKVIEYGLDKLNIKLTVDIDTSEADVQLSNFAKWVWEKFGGDLVKKGGTINIGGRNYTKQQVAAEFESNEKYKDELSKRIRENAEKRKKAEAIKDKSLRAKQLKELQEENKALRKEYSAMYSDDPMQKKTTTKTKKEDVWLKNMNARLTLLGKYLSLYEKLRDTLGEEGAKNKIASDNQFSSLRAIGITDPTDRVAAYNKIYEIYKRNQTTSERRKKTEEVLAKLYDEQADALVRQNETLNEMATSALDKLNKQWETYKKWMDATGNSQMSAQVAFGQRTGYKNLAEQLRDELSKRIDIQKAGGVDAVMEMTASQLDRIFGKAGQNADGVREKIDAMRESARSWNEEMVNSLLEVIKNSKDYATQIDDITRKLDEQIHLINTQTFSEDPGTNADIRKKYIDAATREAERQKSDIKFKQFQEESDWVLIFDDLDRVSTETITSMIDKIDEFSKSSNLSVEIVKKLRDALSKLRDENLQRDPFGGLARSASRANAIRAYLEGGLGKIRRRDGRYILNDFQAKSMGLKAGGTGYKPIELQNEIQGAEADVVKSIENISKTFSDLQNVMNPLINLFSSMGKDMSGVTDVLSTIGTALGAASSTGSSIQNLMGLSVGKDKSLGDLLGIKNAGLWGAAAGAGLSIISSLFAAHDKALQEEIEASQERQKEMENLTTNVSRVLERLMGGIYTYRASAADLEDFQKYFEENPFTKKYKYDYIQEDTREQISEAEKSKSYYDTYLASLKVQRDELQHQIDSERDKKDSDAGKIEDMEQQYADVVDQIKYVAEDMAKELYGIDFKSWASELSQTLVDAWASGADAAEAYKDKVSQIMKEVGVNIITQKYLEPLLEKYMDNFMTYFDQNNGVIGEEGLEIIAQMYEAADKAAEITEGYLQGLEDIANKHGETIKDTSSSSGSNVISGITEDEAGLLIAYVNAMRADLSSNLMYNKRIAEELFPQVINILAVYQAQLISIAENTRRSADAAERLNSTIDSIVSGTKKLSVITYVKK